MRNEYIEVSTDDTMFFCAYASNNNARYILTSVYAHDLYNAYTRKYKRLPHSKWLNKHFTFRKKQYLSSKKVKYYC